MASYYTRHTKDFDYGLYCDNRMGGWPKYSLGGKLPNADMRVPDEYLKGIFFLSVRKTASSGTEEIDYFIGTGFIISGPTRFKDHRIFYLVTAKHILEKAKAAGYDEISIRVNTKDGKSLTIPYRGKWFYAKNPAVDVAVMPTPLFLLPGVEFDLFHSPIENFATDEVIEKESIGIGDDVFAIGLFNQRWGHERNIPIMRTGVIASMPEEPLQVRNDDDEVIGERNAYLVELRSIGGLSGSPVYVHLDFWRHDPSKPPPVFDGEYRVRWHMYMFGVISGHWDLRRQDSVQDFIAAASEDEEIDRLNTGIAIVTPIQEVLDIINGAEVQEVVKLAEREFTRRNQPTYDVPNLRKRMQKRAQKRRKPSPKK